MEVMKSDQWKHFNVYCECTATTYKNPPATGAFVKKELSFITMHAGAIHLALASWLANFLSTAFAFALAMIPVLSHSTNR